jgi:hypothetical protein
LLAEIIIIDDFSDNGNESCFYNNKYDGIELK